jgi:hypothetical protein
MKFEITEAEVDCDVSAGPDWGIHFDKVIDFVLEQTSSNTVMDSEECKLPDLKISLSSSQISDLANAPKQHREN